MTGTLKVTPEKLITTSNEFKTQGTKIRGLTQQMIQIVNSLNGSWEGDAQKVYATRFKALDGDMAQIQLKINEHVSDLIDMAETYKKAESTNTQNISGLSSDYIND